MLHAAKSRAVPAVLSRKQESRPDSFGHCLGVPRALLALLAAGMAVTTSCKKPEAPPPVPPAVEVVAVEQRDVPIYSEAVGTLEADVNAASVTLKVEVNTDVQIVNLIAVDLEGVVLVSRSDTLFLIGRQNQNDNIY